MSDLDLVVHGATEVVVGPDPAFEENCRSRKTDARLLERYENGAVAVVDSRVAAVGPTPEVTREYPEANASCEIDATGRTILPGFVDPHTHALFAGDRSDEFEAKLRGKTYQAILAEGGGILRTVDAVREASDETLLKNVLEQLDRMLAHGTTTAEVKSGYGLDRETELRMLKFIAEADQRHPVDIVPTFMGAHAVPTGEDSDTYTERVTTEQIPAVADQGIAEFCDVFCEQGVFDVAQSQRVLEAGQEAGLVPKIHAEELSHLGGTQLAADVGAASADHLLHSTREDAAACGENDVTPVFLPGTAFALGAAYADSSVFFEEGANCALATDLNPNCFSQSMGFVVALACIGMHMTPAESLVAATRNAARAINREDGTGTLRVGAPGDLVVIDAPSHVHVPYNFGTNLVSTVVADGIVVHES